MPEQQNPKTFEVYMLIHPFFFMLHMYPTVFESPKQMRAAIKLVKGVWGKQLKDLKPKTDAGNAVVVYVKPDFSEGAIREILEGRGFSKWPSTKENAERMGALMGKELASLEGFIAKTDRSYLVDVEKNPVMPVLSQDIIRKVATRIQVSRVDHVKLISVGECRDACPRVMLDRARGQLVRYPSLKHRFGPDARNRINLSSEQDRTASFDFSNYVKWEKTAGTIPMDKRVTVDCILKDKALRGIRISKRTHDKLQKKAGISRRKRKLQRL